MRANVGKPVTRIRRDFTVLPPPHQGVLDPERFKVLPVTPRATKPPGWRLGSGFDGITLEPTGMIRPQISRKQNFGHARTHRFPDRSVSKLDFSTESSPSRHFFGERGTPTRRKHHCNPVQTRNFGPTISSSTADGAFEGGLAQRTAETGEQATSQQAVNSTASVRHPPTEKHSPETTFCSHHNVTVEDPIQVHKCQRRNLDASPAIREPSKSERNGWLKRKRVHFAVADEDEGQLSVLPKTDSVNGSGHGRREAGEMAWTDV